jgi:prefoldin subunit 5
MSDNNEIQKTVSLLKEQTAAFRTSITTLRGRIADLEEKKKSLETAPISKSDYLRMILTDIDKRAEFGRKACASRIIKAASEVDHKGENKLTAEWAISVDKNPNTNSYATLNLLRDDVYKVHSKSTIDDDTAFFLFRDTLKSAATEAIAAIAEWPFVDTNDVSKIAELLESIQVELLELRQQEQRFSEEAQELGLTGLFKAETPSSAPQ